MWFQRNPLVFKNWTKSIPRCYAENGSKFDSVKSLIYGDQAVGITTFGHGIGGLD